MKKLSASKSDKLILFFIIKVVVSSVASVLLFSFIFTQITYKLDLSMESAKIFSIIICALSALCIAFVSCRKIKNNGAIIGLICEIPLVFYTLINLIFNDTSVVFFLIKVALILAIGALTGLLRARKSKKFKV